MRVFISHQSIFFSKYTFWGQEKFENTKGQSEAVKGRTDNAMTKRKGTNSDLQNIAQKTKT